MKPKRSGYLHSLAFEEGEFERSQALLETTSAPLGVILANTVGEALRANLSRDVAKNWISEADVVLQTMLADASMADEATRQAVKEMQRSLSESPQLSDEAVASEIRACSEELAQLVLSHWFAELHTLTITSDGFPLNTNMLPGTRSIEAVLDGLDFSAFGVNLPSVALAVRDYREMLIGQANKGVIEFAPQLFVVFDAADHEHPFRCFSSEDDARSAQAKSADLKAARAAGQTDPVLSGVTASALETKIKRLAETIRAVRRATLPMMPDGGVDLLTLANAAGALVSGASFPSGSSNASRQYGLDAKWRLAQEPVEMLLVESVGLGVDIFSTGLSVNMYEAQDILSAQSDSIRSLLFCYAGARGVNPNAALDIYAVTVAAGVECQFAPIDADLSGIMGMANASEHDFVQVMSLAHGVSSTIAEKLMSDSRAGAARMASLMNEVWADG